MSFRDVILFETDSGRCEVADFIEKIRQPHERAKIQKILEAVAATETLPVNIFKKMKGLGELWEVRAHQYRLLGFHTREHGTGPLEYVVVHAFKKQSEKTPLNDISVALKRRDTYLARRGDPQ